MRVLIVGATGTIGAAVARALQPTHTILCASHSHGNFRVDLAETESIRHLYSHCGRIDAVVCAAGKATFRPLLELSDADFALGLGNKLMGQVNLVRAGVQALTDGGSFTLTSGLLSRRPMPGGSAISLVNAGLEGFVRGAALELPRGIRINVVAPGWVRETLVGMKMDPSLGTPAACVAEAYVRCVEGDMTGQTVDVVPVAG